MPATLGHRLRKERKSRTGAEAYRKALSLQSEHQKAKTALERWKRSSR
jgi:hypothetical protein